MNSESAKCENLKIHSCIIPAVWVAPVQMNDCSIHEGSKLNQNGCHLKNMGQSNPIFGISILGA